MKEKKRSKSHKSKDKKRQRKSSSSSDSTSSDVWVEKVASDSKTETRDDWMSMTGMLKTYTKDDIHPKRGEKHKQNIDSYNPGTSSRELNPYWNDGGAGLPKTSDEMRRSRQFIKPDDDDDFYPKSKKTNIDTKPERSPFKHDRDFTDSERSKNNELKGSHNQKSFGWKKMNKDIEHIDREVNIVKEEYKNLEPIHNKASEKNDNNIKYMSDEKMNKLAAKLVKAEIMGDTKLVNELKIKLEAARAYRKLNPDANKEDDRVMLISTNSAGNSRPLANPAAGDSRSKTGKRKVETHVSGQRTKYFGNDDKYDLAQMFQQEKYGNNYNEEAELARIASKHTNLNDDLEDIFVDEISKNKNSAKESENDKQRAIDQHKRIEKSLDGCEYCVDSKNMIKHLMISCGNKVYLALPSRKSMVKDQCIITTIQHNTCVTALDEDIWEEIMNYRKAITQFFNSQNKDVVFYETATKLHRYPHMVINCVPMPRDVGDMAAIYFKKALLECEAEWSMNKKVVELKGKNIRKGVPKGLPYFWIDFGMESGFAHVIEDQQLFPKTFAEEIIAGILDLDHRLWKTPQKEYGDLQRKKVLEFIKDWKPFDPIKK